MYSGDQVSKEHIGTSPCPQHFYTCNLVVLLSGSCKGILMAVDRGLQESRRIKFVLVQYNGSELGGFAKSRAGVNKPGKQKSRRPYHIASV
jgi:hypothetical protein